MTKRSLMLAGGGMKVAFQAGVLQVWLDEANLAFDHVDGASGGTLNLVMLCQGMTGTQIANNWRQLDPIGGISVNWKQLWRLLWARSIFTLDGYRRKVFPKWGLDWSLIAASKLDATFNVYNFSQHRLEVCEPHLMTEDRLCACVSLPFWFPPTILGEDTYIDSVYVTDCNLEEAIRRGADELWVIWTVSLTGQWKDGFASNYFQIIEAAANGRFRQICDRINTNNALIAAGKQGEFGRTITLKILQAEVDLSYIFNFSARRLAEAVDSGVTAARKWCAQNGIPLNAVALPAAVTSSAAIGGGVAASPAPTNLQFKEVMRGFIQPGEVDYDRGFRTGQATGMHAEVTLTIETEDVERFVQDRHHEASATGVVDSTAWGRNRPISHGTFNLLVDSDSPARKLMCYRLFFSDDNNHPLTLSGYKDIRGDDGSDAWTDTTTLFTRILAGHVDATSEPDARILGAGIIRIHLPDFLHQLTTFKAVGPTRRAEASAIEHFIKFFLGKLWEVYGWCVSRQNRGSSPDR